MKIHLAAIAALACIFISDAMAAPGLPAPAPAPALPPALAAPVATAARSQQTNPAMGGEVPGLIPALPPSRLCSAKDLRGALWKMRRVYEAPLGAETKHFSEKKTQFMLFKANSTYLAFNTADAPSRYYQTNYKFLSGLKPNKLLQYVLQDSGILYFYKDGALDSSMACFIVANEFEPFHVGEMLLMPPAGASTTRLIKVYSLQKPPVAAPNDNPDNNRKHKRRRKHN